MQARMNLPGDIGNEDGEPVIEERKIKIGALPTVLGSGGDGGDEEEDEDEVEERWNEAGTFASMEGDHDTQRRERLTTTSAHAIAAREAEERT
jgi:hypothetical protein